RDRVGERVLDRMPRLVLANRGVVAGAAPEVAVLGEGPGVSGRPVVRVDHVARGAAARPIVAGMIVGAEEPERRIVQSRLLDIEDHRIGPVERAESARAQPVRRPARILVLRGHSDLERLALPALEDAEDVPGLADLESREWIQIWKDSLLCRLHR